MSHFLKSLEMGCPRVRYIVASRLAIVQCFRRTPLNRGDSSRVRWVFGACQWLGRVTV
ncbi:hypothetical protein CGRA01v4_10295 [Colletotrichum graminicola]|nr:hypothetical protein CGRA01v4_10295 [Colletotrichum graminicola]